MAVSKKIKYTNNVAVVFRLVLLEYGKNLCDEHFSLKSFDDLKCLISHSVFQNMTIKSYLKRKSDSVVTLLQSRDWEIFQAAIFHVAVSIKSNIGNKNNFALVL